MNARIHDTLYLVVRQGLPPGVQAAQLTHVALLHGMMYGGADTFVELLEVRSSEDLNKLIHKACKRDIEVSSFVDTDLGPDVTAIALGSRAGKWVRHLKRAFGGSHGQEESEACDSS